MKCVQISIQNNRGQGTIEYVLVLVVVVGIILGGLYQLNSAFKVFADNYFGEYLACLLETGELPSMGGGSTSGECNQVYADFSLPDGSPFVGGVGSDDKDNNSDGQNGSNESSSEAENSGLDGGSVGSGVAQSSPARLNSLGRSTRFRVGNVASSDKGEGEAKKSAASGGVTTSIEGYQKGAAVRIPINDTSGYSRRGRYKADEEEKGEGAIVGTVEKDEVARSGPQLIRINRNISSEGKAIPIEPFSFGYFIRYLLIAIIIIALLIFLGGQILQVSKSME